MFGLMRISTHEKKMLKCAKDRADTYELYIEANVRADKYFDIANKALEPS